MWLSDAYDRAPSSAPPNGSYLLWDAPGVETPRPDEDETAKNMDRL